MGQECTVKGALPTKHQTSGQFRKKNDKKSATSNSENTGNNSLHSKGRSSKQSYPPCRHCRKLGHPPFKCWKRPDAKCSKCNQMGHEAVICNKLLQKHETSIQVDAQVGHKNDKDHIFVAEGFSCKTNTTESWLIDSGCTNHMTYDKTLFRELKSQVTTKIRIGDGRYVLAKGKRTVAITTNSSTKTILDVLYVPEIYQNLLSVGQLLEKGFKIFFDNPYCHIYDVPRMRFCE